MLVKSIPDNQSTGFKAVDFRPLAIASEKKLCR